MSERKKILGTGLVLTALMVMTLVIAYSNTRLNGNLPRADAGVDVSTSFSLLLNESWGYAGESTKVKTSSMNNDFTIGFSNGGSDFSAASSGNAFSTTTDGAYIYTVNLLSGISQIYVKGTSTNDKTGVTVYGHHYSQTECLDDSQKVSGSLNSLIELEPANYVAIQFEGTDNIKSVEIGYSCSTASDPYDHLEWGGADASNWNQSFVGISSTYPVGTKLVVDMDVSVTGDFSNARSMAYAVDSVWSDNSRNEYTDIKSIVTSESGWHHITFVAPVRNFSSLRNNANYDLIDTSSVGNGIYIMAVTYGTKHSFNYKNVTTYEAMVPSGNNGATSNIYYQSIGVLTTELEAGTTVEVEMDVYATGTFDSYSNICAVDTVYSVSGGEMNANTKINSIFAEEGWHHVTFTATVRNFPNLRYNIAYPVTDMSAYGNGIYLISMNKSADSFNYKNVVIQEVSTLIYGCANKTGNGMHQSATGLSTDLAVGTSVQVEMDVYVTGSFNEKSSIYVVDSVWSTESGYRNATTNIKTTIVNGEEGWHRVSFAATVRSFTKLGNNSNYTTSIDTSSFGNAIYILTENNSMATFNYKNVVISAA